MPTSLEALFHRTLEEYFAFRRSHVRGPKASWAWVYTNIIGHRARYLDALQLVLDEARERPSPLQILDIGSGNGFFAILLHRMGHQVTVTVGPDYEIGGFNYVLFEHFGLERVFPLDLPDGYQGVQLGVFDVICLLEVLEHLPHSPKSFLEGIVTSSLRDGGVLLASVPNIARVTNRVKAIFGKSILPSYPELWQSGGRFFGHHREYTLSELRYVVQQIGMDCASYKTSNYVSLRDALAGYRLPGVSRQRLTLELLVHLLSSPFPCLRGVITVRCRKPEARRRSSDQGS